MMLTAGTLTAGHGRVGAGRMCSSARSVRAVARVAESAPEVLDILDAAGVDRIHAEVAALVWNPAGHGGRGSERANGGEGGRGEECPGHGRAPFGSSFVVRSDPRRSQGHHEENHGQALLR